MQRKALAVLAQVAPGTRTTLICQALCEYQRNQALAEKLRSIIREELRNVNLQTAPVAEVPKNAIVDDRKALDFIRSLQRD